MCGSDQSRDLLRLSTFSDSRGSFEFCLACSLEERQGQNRGGNSPGFGTSRQMRHERAARRRMWAQNSTPGPLHAETAPFLTTVPGQQLAAQPINRRNSPSFDTGRTECRPSRGGRTAAVSGQEGGDQLAGRLPRNRRKRPVSAAGCRDPVARVPGKQSGRSPKNRRKPPRFRIARKERRVLLEDGGAQKRAGNRPNLGKRSVQAAKQRQKHGRFRYNVSLRSNPDARRGLAHADTAEYPQMRAGYACKRVRFWAPNFDFGAPKQEARDCFFPRTSRGPLSTPNLYRLLHR